MSSDAAVIMQVHRPATAAELIGPARATIAAVAKRFGLAALMAFLALNVWIGSPLLALWIGSRIQGENSQPSMGAVAAGILCLIVFRVGPYQALQPVRHPDQEG